MLDLVVEQTYRIESRFLEPACGDGAFLIEILRRKLTQVKRRYAKNYSDVCRYSFLALCSIYGIDILPDNIHNCREKLLKLWIAHITGFQQFQNDENLLNSAIFVLNKNIIDGDSLSLKRLDGTPIIFSEWSFITDTLIKRRDFKFEDLISVQNDQLNLFDPGISIEEDTKTYVPLPLEEFKPIDYRTLANAK